MGPSGPYVPVNTYGPYGPMARMYLTLGPGHRPGPLPMGPGPTGPLAHIPFMQLNLLVGWIMHAGRMYVYVHTYIRTYVLTYKHTYVCVH